MRHNLCCSCKKGKHIFCIKCDETIKSTCGCDIEKKYKKAKIEDVKIYICENCYNELKLDEEIVSH